MHSLLQPSPKKTMHLIYAGGTPVLKTAMHPDFASGTPVP
jgi:hypothetical protein